MFILALFVQAEASRMGVCMFSRLCIRTTPTRSEEMFGGGAGGATWMWAHPDLQVNKRVLGGSVCASMCGCGLINRLNNLISSNSLIVLSDYLFFRLYFLQRCMCASSLFYPLSPWNMMCNCIIGKLFFVISSKLFLDIFWSFCWQVLNHKLEWKFMLEMQ